MATRRRRREDSVLPLHSYIRLSNEFNFDIVKKKQGGFQMGIEVEVNVDDELD